MQKTQFLKAMSDMWTSFDARVLRYKVCLHTFYFPHLLMFRWTWALGIDLMIECSFSLARSCRKFLCRIFESHNMFLMEVLFSGVKGAAAIMCGAPQWGDATYGAPHGAHNCWVAGNNGSILGCFYMEYGLICYFICSVILNPYLAQFLIKSYVTMAVLYKWYVFELRSFMWPQISL